MCFVGGLFSFCIHVYVNLLETLGYKRKREYFHCFLATLPKFFIHSQDASIIC